MSVLVKAISVIIRVDAINEHVPGGEETGVFPASGSVSHGVLSHVN